MPTPRGPTSRGELEIHWDYPVYTPKVDEVVADGRSRAVQAKASIESKNAFAFIAKDDPRPLLVLRECVHDLFELVAKRAGGA